MKRIFFFLIFLFLQNCGFEPIYSDKNNISEQYFFNEINFNGDRKISSLLKTDLRNNIIYNQTSKKKIDITNVLEKKTVSKDAAGDPTVLELRIKLNIDITNNENEKNNKSNLVESFRYNNIENKFDLQLYEDDIKKNMINKLSRKINLMLKNLN